MQNFWLFVGNVAAHWVYLMSGIASVIVATWETISNKPIVAKSFWAVALVCFTASCERAWQDEHRNTESVAADKASLTSLYDQCRLRAEIEEAYTRGLEGSGFKQRSMIDDLQSAASKSQATINNCVLSLGKMNPAIREKTLVIIVDLDTVGRGSNSFLFVITTTERRSGLHGISNAKIRSGP